MANEFTLREGFEQLTLRDVQAVSFDILLELQRFCEKHGLRFYMCGGTLLGAVRHKGFIPWDDDVDVFMARPDYDRLVELSKTERIRDDLRVACPQNGGFYRPFMRIYQEHTHVQRNMLTEASGACVWLDILPVDGLPKDPKKLKWLFRLRFLLNKFNMLPLWKPGHGTNKFGVMRRLAMYPLAKLVGARNWALLLEKMGKSRPYETYDTVGCFTGGRYGAGEAMPKAKYEIPETVEFEGHRFETMSCWREYLSGIYGDYMTPPPEKDRYPHLDFTSMPADELAAIRRQYADFYKEG